MSDDCTEVRPSTEYGHRVAGTLRAPSHGMIALSLVCAACKQVQTWAMPAGTTPAALRGLQCYRCHRAELTFSPIGATR